MVVANLTRDAQNCLSDNYALVVDPSRVEGLVRNAIIEFNKEKAQIHFPLYPVRFSSLRSSRLSMLEYLVLSSIDLSSLSHDSKCRWTLLSDGRRSSSSFVDRTVLHHRRVSIDFLQDQSSDHFSRTLSRVHQTEVDSSVHRSRHSGKERRIFLRAVRERTKDI